MPGTRCHCHHRRWSSFQLCLCHCCLASPDAIRCSKRYFCRFKMLGLTKENTCKHWWILPRWEHNLEPLNKSLRILPLVRRTSWLGCERSSQVTLHSRLLVCHRSWFGLVKVLREGHYLAVDFAIYQSSNRCCLWPYSSWNPPFIRCELLHSEVLFLILCEYVIFNPRCRKNSFDHLNQEKKKRRITCQIQPLSAVCKMMFVAGRCLGSSADAFERYMAPLPCFHP